MIGDDVNREFRILEGIRIRTCVQSGFCCSKSPCGYGESTSDDDPACKYLSEPNKIGQQFCGRYEWIVENVPGYEFYPAFGAGCCMPMFNEKRTNILQKLKELRPEDFADVV